jgi:hypothetical protein
MNNLLTEALTPWLGESTWHTYNPPDEVRFHQAMAKVFALLGTPIDGANLEETIFQLVHVYHGEVLAAEVIASINEHAMRAEEISLYLSHTSDDEISPRSKGL